MQYLQLLRMIISLLLSFSTVLPVAALDTIPKEVVALILEFLDDSELASITSASRSLFEITTDEIFLATRFEKKMWTKYQRAKAAKQNPGEPSKEGLAF